MTLGQLRLYLAAEERRQRRLQSQRITAARSAWMDGKDVKALLDALDPDRA